MNLAARALFEAPDEWGLTSPCRMPSAVASEATQDDDGDAACSQETADAADGAQPGAPWTDNLRNGAEVATHGLKIDAASLANEDDEGEIKRTGLSSCRFGRTAAGVRVARKRICDAGRRPTDLDAVAAKGQYGDNQEGLPSELIREVMFLRHVQSATGAVGDSAKAHIVRLVGEEWDTPVPTLLLERAHRDLNYYIGLEWPDRQQWVKEIGRFAVDIAMGLRCLHALGAIHRDIKPANLLVVRRNDAEMPDPLAAHSQIVRRRIIITDMGSTLVSGHTCDVSDPGGYTGTTIPYAAPEVLERRAYGPAVDYWSMGVTLAELLLNRYLFTDKNQAEESPPPSQGFEHRDRSRAVTYESVLAHHRSGDLCVARRALQDELPRQWASLLNYEPTFRMCGGQDWVRPLAQRVLEDAYLPWPYVHCGPLNAEQRTHDGDAAWVEAVGCSYADYVKSRPFACRSYVFECMATQARAERWTRHQLHTAISLCDRYMRSHAQPPARSGAFLTPPEMGGTGRFRCAEGLTAQNYPDMFVDEGITLRCVGVACMLLVGNTMCLAPPLIPHVNEGPPYTAAEQRRLVVQFERDILQKVRDPLGWLIPDECVPRAAKIAFCGAALEWPVNEHGGLECALGLYDRPSEADAEASPCASPCTHSRPATTPATPTAATGLRRKCKPRVTGAYEEDGLSNGDGSDRAMPSPCARRPSGEAADGQSASMATVASPTRSDGPGDDEMLIDIEAGEQLASSLFVQGTDSGHVSHIDDWVHARPERPVHALRYRLYPWARHRVARTEHALANARRRSRRQRTVLHLQRAFKRALASYEFSDWCLREIVRVEREVFCRAERV